MVKNNGIRSGSNCSTSVPHAPGIGSEIRQVISR